MKRALIDTLEWYSEATPQDRLDDGGERASNLLVQLNDDDDADKLTALLEAAAAVVEQSKVDSDVIRALRQSLMEWQD